MIYSDFRYFGQRVNFVGDSNGAQNQLDFYSLRLRRQDDKSLVDRAGSRLENAGDAKLFQSVKVLQDEVNSYVGELEQALRHDAAANAKNSNENKLLKDLNFLNGQQAQLERIISKYEVMERFMQIP